MIESVKYITSKLTVKKLKYIRKIYILTSILIGIISPLICLYFAKEVNLTEKPLSYFALIHKTSLFWLISLIILAIGIFWNGKEVINKFINNRILNLILKIILSLSFISLIGTALITMKYGLAHKIFALSFFLLYNFFVFLFGLFMSFSQVRQGFFSVITGSLMLLSALLIIPFPSYGIAEIVYIQICVYWNLIMFIKSNKLIGKKIIDTRRKPRIS